MPSRRRWRRGEAPRGSRSAAHAVRNEGVRTADLEGARTRLIASFREDAGTADGVAAMVARDILLGTPPSEVLSRQERLSKLTGADVARAAQALLLSDDRLRLVVVGPSKLIEVAFETIGIGPLEWRTRLGEGRP